MSGRGRTITGVHLSHSASTEYLFPDADYSDKEMTHISAYRVPDAAKSSEFTYDCSVSLADGQSVELPPIYQLEGVATTDADPYSTTISTEGVMLAWRPIQWRLQESSMPLRLMTDLPRNTHVVVNILLKDQNDIALEVILVPYRGVNLDPGFGLD